MKTLMRKVLIRVVRLVLRGLTLLRCPRLILDPTVLACRLWPESRVITESRNLAPSPTDVTRLQIIIPYRDCWHLTLVTLESLLKQDLTGVRVLVSLVDNGSIVSTQEHVSQWLKVQQSRTSIEFDHSRHDIPFNFSTLNNSAFQRSKAAFSPDYVLFLNNDVAMENPATISRLLQAAASIGDSLGALGCTLLYPNGRVQHTFLAPGVVLVGAHPLKGLRFNHRHQWYQGVRMVPAVTGALLLMRASTFEKLGCFEEKLATCYQDVDLCLKASLAGLQNFTIADLVAIHHESASRKSLPPLSEAEYIYGKWGAGLTAHSSVPMELSRWSEYPVLSLGEPPFPWRWLFPKV
jgi:GT2 family glycosyltransferase